MEYSHKDMPKLFKMFMERIKLNISKDQFNYTRDDSNKMVSLVSGKTGIRLLVGQA